MKLYSSFLIRYWLIQEPSQGERSVFSVEHIQTGEHTRVASLSDAQDWIVAACRAARPEQQEEREKMEAANN